MQVEYRAKHRKEGSHGLSMLGRPDIEMAKKAAKLSSQVKQMGKQQLWCEEMFKDLAGRSDSQNESAVLATREILQHSRALKIISRKALKSYIRCSHFYFFIQQTYIECLG